MALNVCSNRIFIVLTYLEEKGITLFYGLLLNIKKTVCMLFILRF